MSYNKHLTCLVCAGQRFQPLSGYYEPCGLVKCESCGFVFMEKIPTAEELGAHYSSYSYTGDAYLSPLTIKSYNALLDEFEKYRKTNKLLDIGCGRGWFLETARSRGWEVYGTEYSEAAVQLCQTHGIHMIQGQLNSATFANDEFDVITSFEVIEHINNPREEIAFIHKFLRKGGLFYCTTPNFNSALRYYLKSGYNIINYPEHLSYYTKSTLNKLLEQNGFKNIKFLSTGISLTRINLSKKISNEPVIASDNADEKLRKNIDSKWYLKIAKNLANSFLTTFNLGLTLKGYYRKL